MQPQNTSTGTGSRQWDQWREFYYRDPHPELVPQEVKKMAAADALSDFNLIEFTKGSILSVDERKYSTSVFVVSQVFRKHPDNIWGWMKEFRSLPEKPLRGLIEAVWLSNTAQGRETLQKFSQSTMKVADFAIEVIKRPAVDVETLIPREPSHFDFLWSAFFIYGDMRYIGKIIDAIPSIKQRTDIPDILKRIYIGSIHWSITDRLTRHPQIGQFVLTHCLQSPHKNDGDFQILMANIYRILKPEMFTKQKI